MVIWMKSGLMAGLSHTYILYQLITYPFFSLPYRYTAALKDAITALLSELQPHAVVFGGFGVTNNSARWVGTEMGVAPDPNWSTGNGDGGDPHSPYFNPAECDTTLQNSDRWFWV